MRDEDGKGRAAMPAIPLFLLSGGPVDVDADLTVFIQLGILVALMLVLKPVLFDPMLRLFEEREMRIEGAKAEARAMDQASAEAELRYEEAMKASRAEAAAERDKLRAEGAKAEAELMAKARAEAAGTVDAGFAKARAEAEAARSALGVQTKSLAGALASRVLGREVA